MVGLFFFSFFSFFLISIYVVCMYVCFSTQYKLNVYNAAAPFPFPFVSAFFVYFTLGLFFFWGGGFGFFREFLLLFLACVYVARADGVEWK